MSMAIENDAYAELIGRAGTGDRKALRRLYESTAPRLFALALRVTRKRITAEQVLLHVFLAIWRREVAFDRDLVSGWGWLVGTTRSRCFEVLERDGRPEAFGTSFALALAVQDPGTYDRLAESEQGRLLQACLDELPELQQRVILFAYLDGAPHEEVADALAAPPGTVKSWIRHGLVRLKECLG